MAVDISVLEDRIRKNHLAALTKNLAPGEQVIDAVGCGEVRGRLPNLSDSLVLTNKRILIIHGKGFRSIVRGVTDIKLREISNVEFSGGRLGYYATITIHSRVGQYRLGTIGSEQEQAAWPRKILNQVHAAENRRVRAKPPASDIATRLKQLVDLHAAGSLSNEEFISAKRRLIEG